MIIYFVGYKGFKKLQDAQNQAQDENKKRAVKQEIKKCITVMELSPDTLKRRRIVVRGPENQLFIVNPTGKPFPHSRPKSWQYQIEDAYAMPY